MTEKTRIIQLISKKKSKTDDEMSLLSTILNYQQRLNNNLTNTNIKKQTTNNLTR